jgi:hypothetical protein
MDKVQKPNGVKCDTPLSEPYKVVSQNGVEFNIVNNNFLCVTVTEILLEPLKGKMGGSLFQEK